MKTMATPVCSHKTRSDSEVDHLVQICQQDLPDVLKNLLENRSIATRVSEKTKDGTTALHESCCYGRVECTRILLGEDPDATIWDDRGWAPIHTATYNNHQDVIKLLLDRNACTVDCLSKTNETPLHIACWRGYLDLVKYLIDRGADVLKKDRNNSSILHHAASSNNADLVDYLLTISLMKSCLNVKNKFDRIPLHNAATLGCASTLRVLMQSQEEPLHVRRPMQDKLTPLQLAEALGNTRCQAILRSVAEVPVGENPRPHRTGKPVSRAHSMPKMRSHRLHVPGQHAQSLPKLDPHKQHLHEQRAHSLRHLDPHKQHLHEQRAHSLRHLDPHKQHLHEQRARSTHSSRTSSASVSPSPTPPLSQEDVHVGSSQGSRFSTPPPGNRSRPQTKLMSAV